VSLLRVHHFVNSKVWIIVLRKWQYVVAFCRFNHFFDQRWSLSVRLDIWRNFCRSKCFEHYLFRLLGWFESVFATVESLAHVHVDWVVSSFIRFMRSLSRTFNRRWEVWIPLSCLTISLIKHSAVVINGCIYFLSTLLDYSLKNVLIRIEFDLVFFFSTDPLRRLILRFNRTVMHQVMRSPSGLHFGWSHRPSYLWWQGHNIVFDHVNWIGCGVMVLGNHICQRPSLLSSFFVGFLWWRFSHSVTNTCSNQSRRLDCMEISSTFTV
jgi:hypothetical protein